MAITVGELKKILSKIDNSRIVVLSRDSEGNGFSPLAGFCNDMKLNHGEPMHEALTDELRDQGYTDGDIATGGKPCIVLWPQ